MLVCENCGVTNVEVGKMVRQNKYVRKGNRYFHIGMRKSRYLCRECSRKKSFAAMLL